MRLYQPRDQVRKYTCGPSCIANALALYGIPTSQEEAQGACETGKDGTNEDDLKKGLRKLGFYPMTRESVKRSDNQRILKWAKAQTDQGRFVICSINGEGSEGHWVLILNISRAGVMVWNPSYAYPEIVTKRNLFQAWWGVDFGYPGLKSGIWAVALAPRTKILKRAAEIRKALTFPKKGKLPVDKGHPEPGPTTTQVEGT